MKETEAQSLIIKAVRDANGAGQKLSHKFVVGVSDLLLKLPKHPAMLIEVKLNKFTSGVSPQHQFKLDVTHLQDKFLVDFANAGMTCGVISCLVLGAKLRLAMFKLDEIKEREYTALIAQHTTDGRVPEHIIGLLEKFANGTCQ
jgi:hypothetical protein